MLDRIPVWLQQGGLGYWAESQYAYLKEVLDVGQNPSMVTARSFGILGRIPLWLESRRGDSDSCFMALFNVDAVVQCRSPMKRPLALHPESSLIPPTTPVYQQQQVLNQIPTLLRGPPTWHYFATFFNVRQMQVLRDWKAPTLSLAFPSAMWVLYCRGLKNSNLWVPD